MRALASCAARRHALGSALQGAVRACARRRRRRTRGRALRGNLQRSEARGLAACEALPLQCAAACAAARATPPRSCTAAGAAITSAYCCWAGAPRLCRSGTCTAPRCATRWRMGRWRRRRCCWLRQARLHVHAAQARRTRHVACHHRRPRVPRRCRVRARCPARNPPMEAAAEAFAPLALRAALAAAMAHAARARSVPGGGRGARAPRWLGSGGARGHLLVCELCAGGAAAAARVRCEAASCTALARRRKVLRRHGLARCARTLPRRVPRRRRHAGCLPSWHGQGRRRRLLLGLLVRLERRQLAPSTPSSQIRAFALHATAFASRNALQLCFPALRQSAAAALYSAFSCWRTACVSPNSLLLGAAEGHGDARSSVLHS